VNSNVRRHYEKMYECSACTSIFIVIQFRRPESMPCLREPLHCPFCMSTDNSLVRVHSSPPMPDAFEITTQLLNALKKLEEQVADFRAGRTWDASYVGLKDAHLQAKVAIRRARDFEVSGRRLPDSEVKQPGPMADRAVSPSR
jgi:hypothetical protein